MESSWSRRYSRRPCTDGSWPGRPTPTSRAGWRWQAWPWPWATNRTGSRWASRPSPPTSSTCYHPRRRPLNRGGGLCRPLPPGSGDAGLDTSAGPAAAPVRVGGEPVEGQPRPSPGSTGPTALLPRRAVGGGEGTWGERPVASVFAEAALFDAATVAVEWLGPVSESGAMTIGLGATVSEHAQDLVFQVRPSGAVADFRPAARPSKNVTGSA